MFIFFVAAKKIIVMDIKHKNKKSYYQKRKSKTRQHLQPGLQGFLCSCNNREKDCIKEAYNILNKYTDTQDAACKKEEALSSKDKDIEDELDKELNDLKNENLLSKTKTFQTVESGAKNIIFIKTTLADTVNIAYNIVKEIHDSKLQQTRFLIRLIPIEATCKAYINDIKIALEPLINKYFLETPKVFSIVYNHRNNNCLNKEEVIDAVANIIMSKRKDHSVNLKSAELSVIIEVIKGIALLSIVPDYLQYKKYNLHVNINETNKE